MAEPLPPIDEDITRAHTLPGRFYRDPDLYLRQVEEVLARGWHFLADAREVPTPGDHLPVTLLADSLDEPLLLTRRDVHQLHVLANVCPHRGNLVALEAGCGKALRCDYHGRRFALDGQMLSAPEFDGAVDFPAPADSMPEVPHHEWGELVFASVDPSIPAPDWLAPVVERVDWLPLDRMELDPATARDFEFDGHWALYCDNYLEGFHIPYVHPALAKVLDYRSYRTEVIPSGSLQVGIAAEGEPALEPPEGHRDHGQRIGGYYFFLHPATMLNFYPWGLSLNAVQPAGPARTRVHFREYVWAPSLRDAGGAGGDLDAVELEDEAVVGTVLKGIRSRFYDRGRYSPAREVGVHRFHRMLMDQLGSG
jgi:choline monooxygenase